MSYNKICITDKNRVVSGELHGAMTEVLIAALTAEPETIEELELASTRYVEFDTYRTLLSDFAPHEDFDPCDAGIIVIDLAAKVIGCDSTYSSIARENDVSLPSEFEDFDGEFDVPYLIPDDWLVCSMLEFKGLSAKMREDRAANPPLDIREVLYGRPLIEFLVDETLAVQYVRTRDAIPDIHAKWLMTLREDLNGQTPREAMLEKHKFTAADLHSRFLQRSYTNIRLPAIPVDSYAFRFAGFGTNELVLYYDLIRFLIDECWSWSANDRGVSDHEDDVFILTSIKDHWLDSPGAELHGRTPRQIINMERQRLPIILSAKESIISDDCDMCAEVSRHFDRPMFWGLDGCNMDHRFEFSFFRTREEWDEEERRTEKFNREFSEKYKRGELPSYSGSDEEPF